MSTHDVFRILVGLHILAGAPGLLGFWVPVLTRKGSPVHRGWGRMFTIAMLVAATCATGMSALTLYDPTGTHPHLTHHAQFSDPALVRGIFGWMMLYLAILTINLAWYGWHCVLNRSDHARNRGPVNMTLQGLLTIAAVTCAWQGVVIGQPMMIGLSLVGFATVGTNLWFILNPRPAPSDWLLEHIKAIVGTGISVYTAFLAFGAVRFVPEIALAPALWAVPLVTGLGMILYHQREVRKRFAAPPQGRPVTPQV